MTTTSQSAALGARMPADARQEASSFGDALLQRVAAISAHIRVYWVERRTRHRLADLSDALLRDIGIAEDEIPRIRARDRFTPRAWTDRMGSGRRCDV
ncbi:MAG: DUF1127 domain-containing protein [Hyphomicrobiaceae bacterium]|nr:DUF1127 domain-containing protein [Hyphomicrobiaceae bacterium]